jgi:hypothetical protein
MHVVLNGNMARFYKVLQVHLVIVVVAVVVVIIQRVHVQHPLVQQLPMIMIVSMLRVR